MLKWEIENGVVSKLYIDDENYINPWGAETADSSAFFSLETGVGYRFKYLNQKHSFTKTLNKHDLSIQMKEGSWDLNIQDEIKSESKINRKMSLVCKEDSFLMDFVLRFRFLKKHIEYAEIADKKFIHEDTNIYNQFVTNSVFLKGKSNSIKISINDFITHEHFQPEMYVRDRGDEWIVHVRMFPKKSDKDVIKLCSILFKTRPIAHFLTKILLSFKYIRKNLWYRGEKSPYKSKIMRFLNPNAFALVKIKAGDKLMWNVDMDIIKEKE
jgi:hypothetical protein